MGSGWTIAKVRGIPIRLHISLVLLLLYLVFSISVRFRLVAIEADVDPSQVTGTPLMWGFLLGISILVSVAVHELGHSFVAMAQGARVRGITLMMLGGVSQIENLSERPWSEFKMALIGPMISLAIAAFSGWVYQSTQDANVAVFAYWLASANLVLGLFNLIPAFPLDGGRALRSALASRQGTLRATQSAVKVSRGFAWILGIFGAVTFNILLLLIAFFVHQAAQAELTSLLARSVMRGITARDVLMRMHPVRDSEPVSLAVDRMLQEKASVLPVNGGQSQARILSLARVRRVPRAAWDTTTVGEIADPAARVVEIDEPIANLVQLAGITPSQALPVTENGTVVGVLRYSDLSELLQLRAIREPLIEAEPAEEARRPEDKRAA